MTKSEILKRVASYANADATTPTGDELNQWSEYLELAQEEWFRAYDPQVLIKVFNTTMAQSGTSVALPADFKGKFAGFININGKLSEEFKPSEHDILSGAQAVKWGGNSSTGFYMVLSQALTSNASLAIPYHSRATSLSTLTSVSPIPDSQFLVTRTTEYVLMQRGNPTYVEFQAKADLLLQRMVAAEVSTDIQRNKTIRTSAEYSGFTFGED